jgi:hypothetical protein
MKLLQNEQELMSSVGKKVILTNYRISQKDELTGKSYSISIFLEDISSIENQYKSSPVFLIIAAIALLGGFATGGSIMLLGLVASLILVAMWWFSRKHIITIKPNGGSSLNILVEKIKKSEVENFVYNIVKAKSERINEIYKV